MQRISEITRDIPGVDHAVTISGVSILDNFAHLANAGIAFVILKDWDTRLKEKGQDVASIRQRLNGALQRDILGAMAFAALPPPIQGIGNVSGFTMQVEISERRDSTTPCWRAWPTALSATAMRSPLSEG